MHPPWGVSENQRKGPCQAGALWVGRRAQRRPQPARPAGRPEAREGPSDEQSRPGCPILFLKNVESGTTDAERGSLERSLTHASAPVSCCSEGKPGCSCVCRGLSKGMQLTFCNPRTLHSAGSEETQPRAQRAGWGSMSMLHVPGDLEVT